MFIRFILVVCLVLLNGLSTALSQVTAIRAGNLIDPETGTVSKNVIILVEQEKITGVSGDLSIPAGATLIDLSDL